MGKNELEGSQGWPGQLGGLLELVHSYGALRQRILSDLEVRVAKEALRDQGVEL